MSIEAMAIVLHHSRLTGTKKLLLVGIANHDGDGGAWPTIPTLAKYANIDERNVRRRLAEIVEEGELAIQYNAGGNRDTPDHERPNLYEVLVSCPPNCDGGKRHRLRPLEVVQGGEGATASPPEDPRALQPGGGATAPPLPPGATAPPGEGPTAPPGGGATAPQTVLEPSPNRPSSRAPRSPSAPTRAGRLPEDWTPTPDDLNAVRADAPDVDLDREFRRFKDYWLSASGRAATKTEWGRAYRNWMRKAQDDLPSSRRFSRPPTRVTETVNALDALGETLRARERDLGLAPPAAPTPPAGPALPSAEGLF